MFTQPVHEVSHHGFAPHPGGKTLEPSQRLVGGLTLPQAANKLIHPVGVGPVRLRGNGAETLLLDQPFRDPGTCLVDLMCAMRTLADQHDARIADDLF